jgi:hypothetical protein
MRIPSLTMTIDLNTIPGEGSEEPLSDLNQELHDDDGGGEIHYHQEDQLHLIKEAQGHPLIGQSHYLRKEQHGGMHAIDLNIPACEGKKKNLMKVMFLLVPLLKASNCTV